jgi:hypothetical protein
MRNIQELSRQSRSRSISPSVSFDNSQSFTELEKQEKLYYGARVSDMCTEITAAFDDLLRFVNSKITYSLFKGIKSNLKEEDFNKIVGLFLEESLSNFCHFFDLCEASLKKLLSFHDNSELKELLKGKFQQTGMNTTDDERSGKLVDDSKFEEDKKNYFLLLREHRSLLVEIDLQEKINEHKNKNFQLLHENLEFLENQLENKQDTSFIEKNLHIIDNKIKMMRRDLKLLNN